ncbi:MAG: ABC transporter permease [Lentisphaerae bacterium]|nr:ABC transporter permease [Lentisphaerota bacterium]
MTTGSKAGRRVEWMLTLPSLLWLVVLFVIPTVLVLAISFRPPTPSGGVGDGWTLQTVLALRNPSYPVIVWRTLRLSAETALICLFFGLPVAYLMARSSDRAKRVLLLLVIVPFWTSFLIRIFAWKVLLHPEGVMKQAFAWAGLVAPDASLMYNEGAVLLVLVYTYLPFAILPLYAAAERFDFGLVDAAMDLGCHKFRALLNVFIPGISRGLATALVVVFVPALGSYVIPDIVGGPGGEMLGNKIAQRVFVDRNLPHASALSSLLTVAVVVPMLAGLALRRHRVRPGGVK